MSGINLLTASMELGLVKMLRGAMAGPAGCGCEGARGMNQPGPRDTYTPSPRFESRVVYHPTPRFEGRQVHRPVARIEPVDKCLTPANPERPPTKLTPSPIVPVWKLLPNITPSSSVQDVKVHIVRPDIRHKGTLIDAVI